jgi:FkbM family methyltransferase
MLTSDEVIWGYRYILGRDPENRVTANRHAQNHADWRDFRSTLLASSEFRSSATSLPQIPKWVAAEVLRGDRLMWIDLADDYVSRGCLLDAYEPLETEIVRRYLEPGQVFLDIGANVGWFTMLASTIVGNLGHIHSFEPRRPTVDYLKRSIALSGLTELVTVHDFGLADASREVILAWEPVARNPGHTYLKGEETETRRATETPRAPVRRLDDLEIKHVDLIKMDIEGAELLALEGAVSTIEANRPIVLSEVYPEQLKAVSGADAKDLFGWFHTRGYRSYIVDTQRNGEEITSFPADWHKDLLNVLFIQDDRARALRLPRA